MRDLGIYFPGTQDEERRKDFATSCQDFPGDGRQLSGALRAGLAGCRGRAEECAYTPIARLCFLCKFLERVVGRKRESVLKQEWCLYLGPSLSLVSPKEPTLRQKHGCRWYLGRASQRAELRRRDTGRRRVSAVWVNGGHRSGSPGFSLAGASQRSWRGNTSDCPTGPFMPDS